MPISSRLSSPMFLRPDDGVNARPKRIVFLSVEGNNTEIDYFRLVDKYRERLGVNSLVRIEPLSRHNSDTRSAPEHVFALLEEYIHIRTDGIKPEEIKLALKPNGDQYSLEEITCYLNGTLPSSDAKRLDKALRTAKIDLDYQKFLRNYKGDENQDVFAVMVDRDQFSHTNEQLMDLLERCRINNYGFYISNPCFEFWLLLHLSDVKKEYANHMDEIRDNAKVSHKHTFVSCEVSKKAGHNKSIPERKFTENYLMNVDAAIERASDFPQDENTLLSQIGSNIPELFRILREE